MAQADDKPVEETQRLNKAIAATGYCSRRHADELIRDGRVKVNGETVTDFSYGVNFNRDSLAVDNQAISKKQFDYLILNKPRGVVTTCDDEFGRENVLELLPERLGHLKPVGRLDLESEGLLILTNDGELAQMLTHPSKHVLKNYEVTVSGKISDLSLDTFRDGMELSDGPTQPAKIKLLERKSRLIKISNVHRRGAKQTNQAHVCANWTSNNPFNQSGCRWVTIERAGIRSVAAFDPSRDSSVLFRIVNGPRSNRTKAKKRKRKPRAYPRTNF